MIIKPTIGRIVWYWPSEEDLVKMPGIKVHDKTVPFAAEVVFAWHDTMVNLAVKDHAGQPFMRPSVYLLQPNEPAIPSLPFCQWMPHQAGQAAKHTGPELNVEIQGVSIESTLATSATPRGGMNTPLQGTRRGAVNKS